MIRKDNTLPRNLKILTDATSASYNLSRSEISEMLNILINQIKPYQSVKTALIHEKPVETALSLLVDNDKPITGYEHKVFSTREAALKWLLY